MAEADPMKGVVARLDELVAIRPRAGGGFAPGGKVRTHQLGGHRSGFRGRGMEFDEVRAYQPGDDIRTIDWRVTARTGRAHTKLFQEERERPVLVLADARAAMRFGTRGCFKSVLAAQAAAILSWVGIAGGDRVGGVVIGPAGVATFRPERSRRRILSFVKSIADATADAPRAGEPPLAAAIAHIRALARPGSLIFLVSDFFDLDDHAVREVERLALQSHVTNLFVFDPLEAALPGAGSFPVTDGRIVARLDVDHPAARAAYAQRFQARRDAVERMSRERGMTFLPLDTGQNPVDILHPERLGAKPSAAARSAR